MVGWPLSAGALGLAGGVALGSSGAAGVHAALASALCALAIALCARAGLVRSEVGLIVLALITCALGIVRSERVVEQYEADGSALQARAGEQVVLEGVVAASPDEREGRTLYTVDVVDSNARIMVIAPAYPALSFSERVEVVGELRSLAPFASEHGRVFNYPRYRAVTGVHFDLFADSVRSRGPEPEYAPLARVLYRTKESFLAHIESVIPEPASALAGGILLGEKRALGEELTESFRRAGVIHIVVLSGFNVTIIAEFIRLSLRFLPLVAQVSVSSVLMILFALMVGGGATIVRATIMGLLAMLARATGSVYLVTRALILAGVVMIWWNPFILLYDPSFQLSFLATLGLIHLAPVCERFLTLIPSILSLRAYAAITIATQLAVAPFLLYQMGEISLVAVLANMLVLIAVPPAMLASFVVGCLAYLIAPGTLLLSVVGAIAYALLAYIIGIASWLGSVPLASVSVPPFSFVLVVGAYALLIYLWHTARPREGSGRVAP